jgi:hypothetical protein
LLCLCSSKPYGKTKQVATTHNADFLRAFREHSLDLGHPRQPLVASLLIARRITEAMPGVDGPETTIQSARFHSRQIDLEKSRPSRWLSKTLQSRRKKLADYPGGYPGRSRFRAIAQRPRRNGLCSACASETDSSSLMHNHFIAIAHPSICRDRCNSGMAAPA